MNGLPLGPRGSRGGREETTHSLFGGEQQKRTFPFIDHQSRGGDRTVNLADHRLYNSQPVSQQRLRLADELWGTIFG